LIRANFSALRIKNLSNFEMRDKNKATIFYGQHTCWWDGMVAFILCKKILKTDLRLMIEELHHLPVLAHIGGFSVNKKTPQSSLKSLKYSVECLQDPKRALWIFPQGIIRPPEYRPIEFASGISYICSKLNGVNLVPVATRYQFLRSEKPEILIEIGNPMYVSNVSDRKGLTSFLEQDFTNLLDRQFKDISTGHLEEYETIYYDPGFLRNIQSFCQSQGL